MFLHGKAMRSDWLLQHAMLLLLFNILLKLWLLHCYWTMFMSVTVTVNIKLITFVLLFCKSKYTFWPASNRASRLDDEYFYISLGKKYNTFQSVWVGFDTRVTNDGCSDVSECLQNEIFSRVVLNWLLKTWWISL